MKQSEIWLINLDPSTGAEIRKTRPAIIVNDDALGRLPLRIIIPVTDWKENYSNVPWMVRINPDDENGLSKVSSADCFQIRSVSEERFIKKIGSVNPVIAEKIKSSLSKVLSIW